MLNRVASPSARGKDLLRQPLGAVAWWCLPIAAGVSAALLAPSSKIIAAVWSGALVWMGAGCLLNALRCHRLHCYFSAPVLFAGAVVVALLGFGALNLGPRALGNAVSITLLLALLSFVPDMLWGRYGQV